MFTRANELANKHSDLSRRAGTARGNLSMRNEEHILWQCTFLMNMISCCSNRACMVLILKCSAKSFYEKGTPVIRQWAHSQTKKISCTRSILWICDCAVPLHTHYILYQCELTNYNDIRLTCSWTATVLAIRNYHFVTDRFVHFFLEILAELGDQSPVRRITPSITAGTYSRHLGHINVSIQWVTELIIICSKTFAATDLYKVADLCWWAGLTH